MKFSTSQQSLAEALRVVTAATSRKSTMPITECVLLIAGDDGCRVEATDLEVHASAEFKAEVAKPGRAVLPAKKFAPYVYATDKEATVNVQDGDNWRVKVKAGSSQATIAGIDPESFPDVPGPSDHVKRFAINGKRLAKMIEWVSMTIPQGLGIGSGLCVGAMMDVADGIFSLVSRDPHRCSDDREPAPGAPDLRVTIPRKALQIVASHCGNEGVDVSVMESQALFSFGGVKVTTLLLGKFQDWRPMAARMKRVGSVSMPVANLRASIERAAMFLDGQSDDIVLSTNGAFCIGTTNTESSVDERVDATIEGDPIPRMGFKPAYLLSPLAKLSGETATLHYSASLGEPVEIREGSARYMAMACRLREGE